MKAMILAAGRGERMRPLTDTCPKPLLEVGGLPLIGWHLRRLAAAGITDVVINHAWLGHLFEARLGDGRGYGVRIAYSAEGQALETAGGIAQALPLLGSEPFVLVSGDLYCDYDFGRLRALASRMAPRTLAHLVMVDNPPYHPHGDFALIDGLIAPDAEPRLCYANIALCRPGLVAQVAPRTVARLGPILADAARAGRVGGERFDGLWINVGTPDDLAQARAYASG
ncbi:nucleotidyltransferase family protein [Chitiniphilus purpureus]|uniref:Nucleotidyltransferase family protein n=1 Tax=Chitiniphilus purpureus TaxID=2981137 RepID=A0ABY6DKZ4_9NEIS|nr:nucleotidyltransferase family protein [Chitiniphilus sp. CD1]UXY15025.1 nucleotidyltransferase family protein [Chitiniphilus sp. CD1]